MLQADKIAKKYKRDWIFKNLSLTIQTGDKWAILGPNGSGKSTLLSCLTGAIPLSQGEVQLKDVFLKTVEEDELPLKISFVAPYMELIEEMNVVEHLNFHLKFKPFLAGISIPIFLELSELEEHQSKEIRQFSSGMKQRLKLALALFSSTDFVFLDEPTVNLDANGVQWYLKMVDKTSTKHRSIIVASNDPREYIFCRESLDITRFK